MSSYTPATDFSAKDALPSGDSNKVIRGSEFDTEFDAIQTAVNSKADASSPTLTGSGTAVNLTVSGTLNATGTLQINSSAVTATAAELNILDGVTATTAELNYVDGVTSNIQTQLDSKASSATGEFETITVDNGSGSTGVSSTVAIVGNTQGSSFVKFDNNSTTDQNWLAFSHSTTTMNFVVNLTACFSIQNNGVGDPAVSVTNSDFSVAGSGLGAPPNLYVDYSENKVGVGTSAPATVLHIEAEGDGATIRANRSDSSVAGYMQVGDGDSSCIVGVYGGAKTLQFAQNGAAAMTLDTSSNLGVGTTTPARRLHVDAVMRLEPTTTPSSPSAGDIYFDSGTNKLRCYDGSIWNDCF